MALKALLYKWTEFITLFNQEKDYEEYQLGGTTLENGHITNGTTVGANDAPPKERGLCGGGSSSKELPQRYVLVFMSFLAFVNIYMMYLNLSVALPAMVDHNATKLKTLDDQKGVFFENSELESEAYEQIKKNNSTKREKRQRNISQDDLFYLNSENNIGSLSLSIKRNNSLNNSLSDDSISPLVINNLNTVVTLLPLSDTTLDESIYDGFQTNVSSNEAINRSSVNAEQLDGKNSSEVFSEDGNFNDSIVHENYSDNLLTNDNSTMKLDEIEPNFTSFESATETDSYDTSTVESIVINTLTTVIHFDTNLNGTSNTSDGSEASITLNIMTKPTEGNFSLNKTEGKHSLDAKTSHNLNISLEGNSNINKDNLKVDHIKLPLESEHPTKEHEILNYTVINANNTIKRIKRDVILASPIADVNPVSLPSFHVAEIVPVTKVAVTERVNVLEETLLNNEASPQALTNFTKGETIINTFENSTSTIVDEISIEILNQTSSENVFNQTTTDLPITTAAKVDHVTVPEVSPSPPNVQEMKLFQSNGSSTTIDKTGSQIESSILSVMEEALAETTIATRTEDEVTTSFELKSSDFPLKITSENASDHSLNETLFVDSEKEILSKNSGKSDISEMVVSTSSIPETFPINQIGETLTELLLNDTVSEKDITSVYSGTGEFGIINSTETSADPLYEIDDNYATTVLTTTVANVNNSFTSIMQDTEMFNNTSENTTQNYSNDILINNTTSLSVDKLNTILTSNFKENLIKDTTVSSNEEVKNAENFLVEKPVLILGENDTSRAPEQSLATNNTYLMNISLPFVTPLSIPCQTFLFVNCSITGTYHVIDKKGMDSTNSNESDWVTLQPIPQLSDNYSFHIKDDDEEDNDSNERQKLIKRYNFSEHFNLVDCHVIHGDDNENSDIKCITSHGPIELSIVNENDTSASSSSSSSSSSQENDEEEESEEGDEEEEDEEEEGEEDEEVEEEEDEEEKEKEKKGKENEEKEKDEGGFADFGKWVPPGNYRKITLRDKKEDSERPKKEDQENKEENEEEKDENEETGDAKEDDEKTNDDDKATKKLKEGNLQNKKCEESSEECGEEEEEEEEDEEEEDGEEEKEGDGEEEQDENELKEEFAGPASGQIKLPTKIPSTVCFYKKLPEIDSFHGYEDGEFNWEPDLQTRIISAYYWGFLISQIPAGRLSAIVGGKLLLLFGVFMAGIITLFTPLLASAGAYWLLTARVILGMMQGICMPATQALLAKWAPPMERTRMVAYTYSGIAVGAAMGGPLSAYLIQEIGWRTLCYGQGAIALIWSALWFLLIAESPCTHPRITSREREYVIGAIGYQHAGVGIPVPWCSILRSRHVLALMLAQGSYLWAWHTLLHYAPKYIATVLHDDLPVVQSVWGASLACMFVVTCAYGTLADWLRKSRKLSTISVRRAANSICSILSAGFLVGVSQSYCNREAVKVCFALVIAVGFPGAFSGLFANSLDLSPNHAAAITGICGAFATTASILAPYYWSLIVSGRQTLERWRTIWYTCAIFLLLANCLYFLLVGTKEQRWNRPVTLNKTQKRDDEHEVVMPRRRANQTHGMKPKLYASTEHL